MSKFYKETEYTFEEKVGRYPTDWNISQINKLADLFAGGTPSTKVASYWNGKNIWLVPSDLTAQPESQLFISESETKISDEGVNSCSTVRIPAGSVCLSSRATIGECAIAAVDLYTNQGFINAVCTEKLNPKYLLYWIKQNRNYISRYAAGTTFLEISRRTFGKLRLIHPEYPEQTAIATILSKVDETIDATQNSIKAAEKLKKALMQNLLTGKLKPDGTWRSKDELKTTKYGFAFKDWKYCRINDLLKEGYITKVQDGNHGESHPVSAEFVDEGIPFVMASDISKGFVDTKNCKKISRQRADKLRIGFSYKGDVLLSHKASVGYACIVEEATPYIMLTPQVTLYRVNSEKLIPEYLLYFFQLYTFQAILEGLAKQSTRNYIGISNQKKLWVYLPDSITEQRRLIMPLAQIDEETKEKQSKIHTLQRLKKSLMQNLLTGKVRLPAEFIAHFEDEAKLTTQTKQ